MQVVQVFCNLNLLLFPKAHINECLFSFFGTQWAVLTLVDVCGDKVLACYRQYVGESHQRASQRRQTPQGRSGNSSKLPLLSFL